MEYTYNELLDLANQNALDNVDDLFGYLNFLMTICWEEVEKKRVNMNKFPKSKSMAGEFDRANIRYNCLVDLTSFMNKILTEAE